MSKLWAILGRRGSFLLFLALLDLVYGFSLLLPTADARINPSFLFLANILPLELWGLLWLAVGLVCLVFAFRKQDSFGFAAAMFLKILWAMTFLLGWIFVGLPRAYLSATIWGAFVIIIWLISTWPEGGKRSWQD